jgi:hypothetical protein
MVPDEAVSRVQSSEQPTGRRIRVEASSLDAGGSRQEFALLDTHTPAVSAFWRLFLSLGYLAGLGWAVVFSHVDFEQHGRRYAIAMCSPHHTDLLLFWTCFSLRPSRPEGEPRLVSRRTIADDDGRPCAEQAAILLTIS